MQLIPELFSKFPQIIAAGLQFDLTVHFEWTKSASMSSKCVLHAINIKDKTNKVRPATMTRIQNPLLSEKLVINSGWRV